MQPTVLMFARKPPARPAGRLQAARRSRRRLLARLRDDIAIMRAIKVDYFTIAKRLSISPEDARALSPKACTPPSTPRLTRHTIKALLNGKHAHVGGKAIATRAKNLVKIASSYTYEELLEEPGIGSATATQIQLWLEERDVTLRSPKDHAI